LILYAIIILAVRAMGKREIGQLQPSELVVMILISELAAVPMQDFGIPLINGLIPIFILACAEIILSGIALKNLKVRKILSGNAVEIIQNGIINQQNLWQTRMSIDDLLEELRLKNVHNLSDVQSAQIETNGQLSFVLWPNARPITPNVMKLPPELTSLAATIISDGRLMSQNLKSSGRDLIWVDKILKNQNIQNVEDVFLLSADQHENIICIKKENQN
ncbi:MAG: DUF421 domain-containing protein, partial [Clostridiales bacterium]|nr:DUF421 domain-containing protein [Clostridiales bacterium]